MKDKNNVRSRRNFSKQLIGGLGAIAIGTPVFSREVLNNYAMTNKKKLGIALVGLGRYSTYQLAPALEISQFCELKGIVTGTPSKAVKWKKKYNLSPKNIYNYENFDSIVNNSEIDIVYIVLPNSMHKEYTIRAAKARKHVICEKPMAVNALEAQEMIDAVSAVKKQLFIGYRLHYEPHNIEAARIGQKEVYGKVKIFEGSFGFKIGDPSQWRLKHSLSGGGALMDVGIYAIQGARYSIGQDPIALTAQEYKTDNIKFSEVDETIFWQMEFPSGAVSSCITTYSSYIERLYVAAENGYVELSPAYSYGSIKGSIKREPMNFEEVNQQQLHMDGIAYSILSGTKAKNIYGEEGLKDMKIIDAIYKSISTGEKVDIKYS
ncbi:MAG: Gfo/Idh/MocA family oxidoreductase [Flavobacteriaceae bacterium]|nr:Gfo/Idh/MocA family oxidoreductase [Flavobacteriaceae bacterium]